MCHVCVRELAGWTEETNNVVAFSTREGATPLRTRPGLPALAESTCLLPPHRPDPAPSSSHSGASSRLSASADHSHTALNTGGSVTAASCARAARAAAASCESTTRRRTLMAASEESSMANSR
eukprot:scaffold24143_cov146-Isochrysis_galbana.AAC.8